MRKQIKKNQLRYFRRQMNWTQTQLAKAVGSRQEYIQRYERGRHKILEDLKLKIASVLGLPVEVIFPDSEVLDEKTRNKPN